MDVQAAGFGLKCIGGRHTLLHKPREAVAHARLSGFIPREAGNDAVLDHAADARDLALLLAQRHMAVGGTHDDHHLPRFEDCGCWNGDVGIHIGHSHGCALVQPCPARCLLG